MRNFVKSSFALLVIATLTACSGQKDVSTVVKESGQQHAVQAPAPASAAKWDGFSIEPVGKEAKYNIYPLDGNFLEDDRWTYRSNVYGVDEMMKAIPAINSADVDANGYHCEFLCANAQNQVVGWNPNYAAVIEKARQKR